MNKSALLEAGKEVARLAILGALSAVLAWATTQIGSLDPNSVYALVGTVVLRAIDRYIHKNDDIQAKGLVGF